jgi:hypothetical protein
LFFRVLVRWLGISHRQQIKITRIERPLEYLKLIAMRFPAEEGAALDSFSAIEQLFNDIRPYHCSFSSGRNLAAGK